MRRLGLRHFALLALLAVVVLLTAGSARAQTVVHGLGLAKGCADPTSVFAPYSCQFLIANNIDTDVPQDTYTVTSVVDTVHAHTGDVSSGNILGSLELVSSGGATCNGSGAGTDADPYTGSTLCTLPAGSSLTSNPFSYYTVKPSDFLNAGHVLADDVVVTWQDITCETSCPIGDQTNRSGASTHVQQVPSATTTEIEGGSTQAAGSSVSDDVTVSPGNGAPQGAPAPDGTVTLTFYGSADCDPETVVDSGTFTLDSNGQALGVLPEGPLAPGSYGYRAVYNGSNAYLGSTGACEPLTIERQNPSITTQLSSSAGNSGVVVHDSASLSGATGDAAGTVTYTVYTDSECETKFADGGTVNVIDGSVPDSNPVTFNTPGTYYWQASYSGDQNNNAALSTCTDERLVVSSLVDLAITKAGSPATQVLGAGNITWTMVVTNHGPDTDTGVKVSDPMPAGNTYVSSTTTQGTCTGGAILNCDIGTMAAGASVTITLVTTPSTVGIQTNTGTVSGDLTETTLTNNTATASVEVTPFIGEPPCVLISRITPGQLVVGRKTTLTLHLTQKHKAAPGFQVRIKGAGINVVTRRSNAKGVIKHALKMKKKGILRFTPLAHAGAASCGAVRIGVRGPFTPPVTG
ncbi:MAG TPA: DUF11 domain-containing protein [Gaiellaceae bacterium]|nr:DUF11 domain-containing protein [Gaiellaceae bacterium]